MRVADVVEFDDEERSALEASRDAANALNERIARVHDYVNEADERVERHHDDAEPLIAAYEDAVEFLFAQAAARVQAKERELMEMHDFDSPPAPAARAETPTENIVAPPTAPPPSRIGAYA